MPETLTPVGREAINQVHSSIFRYAGCTPPTQSIKNQILSIQK